MTLTRRQFNRRLAALSMLPFALREDIAISFDPRLPPERDVGLRFGLEEASRAASLMGRAIVQTEDAPIRVTGSILKAGDLYFTTRHHDCDLIEEAARAAKVREITTLDTHEWHHSLRRFGAAELNARFTRTTGLKMTAQHWAHWMAVKIAIEASLRAADVSQIPRAIARGKYDGHKGVALTFATTTTSPFGVPLQQPLYVVSSVTDRIVWPRQ